MSNKIKVAAIIEQYGLNKVALASELFPDNKHPSISLTRVINGEAYLSSVQLSYLAEKLGVSVDSLYSDKKWQAGSKAAGVLTFENDDYTAELNTSTWVTKVFKKGTLIHDTVIHNGAQSLSEYLDSLDKLITNK